MDIGSDSAGLIVDLFAGGGGASTGLEAALGRSVDIALNHDAIALAAHKANHPNTLHLEADIWKVKPRAATKGRSVDVLWASPDCTHHSAAKGGKPRSGKKRSLAWAVVRWASAVKPRIIFLENVKEFADWGPLDERDMPIKARKGESFDRWVRQLRALGYDVEHRVLVASEYGAPTSRKRLFLVARRDGQPIRWPAPTHGRGLKPQRAAAECIDWSLPCPSIFDRKKPLAEKTLWRVAQGIRRFVLESAEPFIVQVNHGGREDRSASIREPLSTVTAQRRGHALVAPTLVQTGYGERPGQRPRYLDIHEPLGTVMATGQKHALVTAFIARFFGGMVGTQMEIPLPTITARDHHALTAATLVKFRGDCHSADPREPMPTISAQGNHVAEVRAFLAVYYGNDEGQSLFDPLRTITTRHRLGLVTVHGVEFQIVDIGLRMLRWHELLRAQFGRFAEGYDLSAANTEEGKVKLVGNSVCPEHAEAIVRANAPRELLRSAA